MVEPAYSFSIPSVEDEATLLCRLYLPAGLITALTDNNYSSQILQGAILAHPYGPFGGDYDNPVVLAVTESLIECGFVVLTFNFRSNTSWSGRAEQNDYVSLVGLLSYYLNHLISSEFADQGLRSKVSKLLLGGYSYGSLILGRLPPVSEIIERFEAAATGTSAAEIILRARTLAKQTRKMLDEASSPTKPRGRSLKLKPEQADERVSHSGRPSPVTIGGEETDPSQRRRSRDSRRSIDAIRRSVELPKRIATRIRRRSSRTGSTPTTPDSKQPPAETGPSKAAPQVCASYLVISPVILPFTTSLAPPGPPVPTLRGSQRLTGGVSGAQFLVRPTLAVFGTHDAFTSARRLRGWAERQSENSQQFVWEQIEDAGHFWIESGVMQALQARIISWISAGS